jgi:hypothetical protein
MLNPKSSWNLQACYLGVQMQWVILSWTYLDQVCAFFTPMFQPLQYLNSILVHEFWII